MINTFIDWHVFIFWTSLALIAVGFAGCFYYIFGQKTPVILKPSLPYIKENILEGTIKEQEQTPSLPPLGTSDTLRIPDIPVITDKFPKRRPIEREYVQKSSKPNKEVRMKKVTLTEIYKYITNRESGKSRVKIGDVRETVGILADMYAENPAGVSKALETLGKARLKRGAKKSEK